MSNHKKVMLYLLIIAIGSLVATYIFSLGAVLGWAECNYLSYSFLIVVFSGIFASTLVALLLEYINYRNEKSDIEAKILGNLLVLYITIHTQLSQAQMYLENDKIQIPLNLFDEGGPTIDKLSKELFSFDYNPILKKRNKLYNSFVAYRNTKVADLSGYLSMFKYFNLAINNEKINKLKSAQAFVPTSNMPMIKRAIEQITANAKERKRDISNVLETFSPKRFDWKTNKKNIDANKPSHENDEERIEKFFKVE